MFQSLTLLHIILLNVNVIMSVLLCTYVNVYCCVMFNVYVLELWNMWRFADWIDIQSESKIVDSIY